ncbi:MAG: hypothetical protein QOK25_265, partial [Thermoleophilaceae bacterium]|nr:hypothetical protein [Thermoleophilaceae bacterium]
MKTSGPKWRSGRNPATPVHEGCATITHKFPLCNTFRHRGRLGGS